MSYSASYGDSSENTLIGCLCSTKGNTRILFKREKIKDPCQCDLLVVVVGCCCRGKGSSRNNCGLELWGGGSVNGNVAVLAVGIKWLERGKGWL